MSINNLVVTLVLVVILSPLNMATAIESQQVDNSENAAQAKTLEDQSKKLSVSANDQVQNQSDNNQQADSVTLPEQESTVASQNRSNIIKLEDTIRANKEQPQVLTIVPWQLPTHHQINQTKNWQLPVKKMKPIERNAFLKQLSNTD